MKKKIKFAVIIILFAVLFCVLFVLSSLGGLRFFIPHYFSIAGMPLIEKSYIVVFQDNNELTASGGVISGYGILKFRNGMFAGIDVKGGDIFKKTFVSSDYPKTVSEIMKTYRLEDTNTTIDGVMAVNTKVIEDAMVILNDKKINDYEINKEN